MNQFNSDCVFCKIVRSELPANVVYEDSKCIAFLDIHPINEGHVLIVPKNHVERFGDLTDSPGHLFSVAQSLVKAIENSDIQCDGTNLFLSDGKAAGQEVPHVHIHIVPRFNGDGQKSGFTHAKDGRYSQEQFKLVAFKMRKSIAGSGSSQHLESIDHNRLFVNDFEKSKAWYAKVLMVQPSIDVEGYAEFRIGESGISVSPADEKSPFSTGGQVSYWRVKNIHEAIRHFTTAGAAIYRGPLDIENYEAICQLRDPFGNVIGLVGRKETLNLGASR